MASLHGWQMPADWSANALVITGMAIDPFSPEDILEASGMILGIGLGYSLLVQRGGFGAGGPFIKRLLRYVLGMALLMLIWYGLGYLRHDQTLIIFYALSYLRALLAGACVAGGAPLAFKRLGLADAANDVVWKFAIIYFIGAWALVTGVADLIFAFTRASAGNSRLIMVLSGIISVLFGVLVILNPPILTAVLLVQVLGIYAVLIGILGVGYGLTEKKEAAVPGAAA